MSEFKVDAETQRKLEVFHFIECRVFDYDFNLLDGNKDRNWMMSHEIKRVIITNCIPCVFERTTGGWHVIVLDKSMPVVKVLMGITGFDEIHWDIGRNRLRTRKKQTEKFDHSFIMERHYFYLESANNISLIEYLKYSDEILLKAHKTFWDEDWDEDEPF
jgi:hypothetical protein